MAATQPKRASRGPNRAYVLFCAFATLYVGCLFFDSTRLQTLYSEYWTDPQSFQDGTASRTLGPWSAPLDDVFIHFDFARSAARGRPFEWSYGNGYSSGGTSIIYPFVLAAGYRLGLTGLSLMEWAAVVACVCVFILLLQARHVFRGLPPWAEFLAPPALLGVGALSWALFSGMEIALFLALWAGAFAAWDRIDRGRDDPAPTLFALAGVLGLAGALLVATRPEGAATTGVLAASAALLLRRRGVRIAGGVLLLSTLPCAAVVIGQALMNLHLTGEAAAAGAIAKLELYHPYLTADEKFERWLFYLAYQALRVTQQHFETMPAVGWLVWVFAVVALVLRDTRKRALLLWASFLTWAMTVAMNGQVRWQNERYTMPAVAWLLLAGALGAAGVLTLAWEAPRNKLKLAFAGLTVVLGAFFAWQAAPAFRFQTWYFGRAARNIYDQQVTVGKVLRRELEPPPRLVLLGDAGAIPYVTDAPALDIIGLGGFHGMPFARATRAHVGAAIELIERLDERGRPDVFALYPSWWDELPLWFGSRIGEVPARGNVICGAPSKVLYRANWAALDGSNRPSRSKSGERVVAEFDWADVLSERAGDYRRVPKAEGRIALKLLPNPGRPERDLYDAGRHTPEGTREHITLRGVEPGRPISLVVRAAPVADVSIPVSIDGKPVGTFELPRSDGWVEVPLRVDAPSRGTLDIELGASRERVLYHLWAVAGP
ncbi:MAG TPA: hypothetical protein VFZ53_03850 [Polyangiaceae bacterium]